MAKIKICGITNSEDARWAINLGTDYLGFNFYKESPRKISNKYACEIISLLPPFVEPVGVFVNEEIETIKKIVKKCKFKLVQLHGEETPDYCAQLLNEVSVKLIKAVRVQDESSLNNLPQYSDKVEYFLLDAYVPGVEGGTGETFNWDLALKAKEFNKPFFLAGGLNPDNVAEAITKVHPYSVDVASGIERTPKRKDYDKMKAFIEIVKKLK